ncbi:unnamed protein product [Rotaria sp. Silwood2]|nr:unnamed protein product [Rotaria sp. Silwood2]CAF4614530.1 unnamed protein product [Rotaria sp. Silwood2]
MVRDKKFIDENDLKQNIIVYMRRLNQFRFNIRSTMLLKDQIDLPTNEDIEHSYSKGCSSNKDTSLTHRNNPPGKSVEIFS